MTKSKLGYKEARTKVDRIRDFYEHAAIYLIANILLFVFKGNIFGFFEAKEMLTADFQYYLWLNIILTPIIWGVILTVHGWLAFKGKTFSWKNLKPNWLKRWEEAQLQKFMNEDQ